MTSALTQAKNLAAYNNKLEQDNVKLQYSYNKALADQDRAFQERMSNSAHQREISDLKAAGLNPVLSVTGGQGASTPSGSSASVSKPNVDMSLPGIVMDWATANLNSATSLQRTAMETANALTIARINESTADKDRKAAWNRHITPSGNSIGGQMASIPDLFARGISSVLGYGDYVGKTLFGSSGNAKDYLKSKFVKNSAKSKGGQDIDRMIAGLRQGKTGKELYNYSKIKNSDYKHRGRDRMGSRRYKRK